MKLLLTLAVLGLSSAAFADPVVKITSFGFPDQNSRIAELCGTVSENPSGHAHLRVESDYTTSRPGVYNTFAMEDGKFCVMLTTFTGRARVGLGGAPGVTATAELSQTR